jgi:type IV pilus biogenesis/stability protein PilW
MLKIGMSKISVMTKNARSTLVMLSSVILLSACVTQSYENDNLILENNVSKNDKAATRISLGLGYLNMGNMTQAKLNLEKAKRFSPDFVQVYTAFAHYYETVGENELAVQSFEKALSLVSDDADTLNNYGVFLCRQEKVQKAEEQFLKAIAVPSYLLVAQSYENLASCFLQINDFKKSEQYLSKAIAHSPNRTVTLLEMVRLQYAMGHYQQAKIFLKKFERNTNRFSPGSLALAYKVYWKLGERKKAKNYATMLVRMYPQTLESKQYLLNNLEQIEADDLAQRYNISQRLENSIYASSSPKKRVVKLSPKKSNSARGASENEKTVPTKLNVSKFVTIDSKKANQINGKGDLAVSLDNSRKAKELKVTTEFDNANNAVETTVTQKKIEFSEVSEDSFKNSNHENSAVSMPASTSVITLSKANVDNTKVSLEGALAPSENSQLIIESETPSVSSSVIETKVEAELAKPSVTDSLVSSETFTEPVPAKRDAPLPEIIEYVEEKDIIDDLATDTANEKIASNDVDAEIKKYTVKEGDTLYAISVMYNIKVEALIKWNNMSLKQSLPVGKQLYIENPETVNNINE